MLSHSPRNRSRSPHRDDHTSNQIELTNNNNKTKKDNEYQQRMRNLKSFIQTLINESTSIGSTYDEQFKALENACIEEYHDLSLDRIRRIIRSVLKVRQTHSHLTSPFLHQDHTNILSTTNDRLNSNENNSKKNRLNSTTKTSDLIPSPTSTFDADFLRHAFSQQFRPPIDLSAYFSAATTTSNGSNPSSSLFRPNFSPSNFLQSLTNTAPPPPILVSSHTHTNGTNDSLTTKSSKQVKLSNTETSSIKVLVNAYREAASYLSRSADELEQLI